MGSWVLADGILITLELIGLGVIRTIVISLDLSGLEDILGEIDEDLAAEGGA